MQVVVTIAGSDSSGGAGIQADLKSVSACGAYGASVLTAVTAQSPSEVREAFELPVALVRAQIDAVFDALPVAAVKSGMLANRDIVQCVAASLAERKPAHFVLDPVMVSTSGHMLLDEGAVKTLKRDLLPQATLVTPNRHEARALTGTDVPSPEHAERVGYELLRLGCGAALIKGGHFERGRGTDVLVMPRGVERFEAPTLASPSTHGTGCTLSASIAAYLARGSDLVEAVRRAKTFVTEAIRHGLSWDGETGPTDPFFYLRHNDAARWLETLGLRETATRREPTR